MISFRIRAGELEAEGVVFEAYSGDPAHKDDPAFEPLKGEGPLPEGVYRLGAPFDAPDTGPFSIPLELIQGDAMGRGGFRIHGDSAAHPGAASHGCIVCARLARELCAKDSDGLLTVTA